MVEEWVSDGLLPRRVYAVHDDRGSSITSPKVFIKKERCTYILDPGSARGYAALVREAENSISRYPE